MNLSTAVAIIAIAFNISPPVVSARKRKSREPKASKRPKAPAAPACPCFDEEALSVITNVTVSEDSCMPNITQTTFDLFLSDQDRTASFGQLITFSDNLFDTTNYSCIVNDQELRTSEAESEVCKSLLTSKCEEVKVEPTCPCFDGEDLLVITDATVSGDSCVFTSTAESAEFKLSNQDGTASFSAVLIDPANEAENFCSVTGQDLVSISDDEYDVCVGLIFSRCQEVKEATCPCFDEEDVMTITQDNVAEDACVQDISGIFLSNQDGSISYGLGLDLSGGDAVLSCSANGQQEAISFSDFDECGRLINSRCEEVKPPACPCFDEEDVMTITQDNVAEDACKEIKSEEDEDVETIVLFSQDNSTYFEYKYNNNFANGIVMQCSGRDEASGLNKTELMIMEFQNGQKCDDLIFNHCAAIGKPIEQD